MSYQLLIGGELVDGALSMEVTNPATKGVVAVSPRASRAQLDDAVAAARAAFPKWRDTTVEERKRKLVEIAARVEPHVGELARILTEEQGKPLVEATAEIRNSLAFFRYFASLDLSPRVIEDSPARRVEMRRTPLGVTAAIVPWNFPFLMMAFKLPASLLAGNTVVVKPSPTTPLTALRFGAIVRDVLPPGVLNIVPDLNDLGDALTSHPHVRKVSFTGSTATGARVMQSASRELTRVTLELGGNDAAIVLGDINPAELAPKLFWGAFRNAGQACIGIKRLYVHASIYDRTCEELAKIADATIVGDGLDERTQLGPVQNERQFERVRGIIDDARKVGRVISGAAAVDERGYFIRPTIVRDIDDRSRLVEEEQFGPVLPVLRFEEAEDAIERANASPFGLGGSVWSRDVERATSLAARLEAGTAWVNQHMGLAPNIPFGGAKASGMGVELGPEGLAEYTQMQIVNIAKGA